MSLLNDQEWVQLIREFTTHCKRGCRQGQSYMNALHEVNLELYKEITGTDNDCFYSDGKIVNFMKFLIDEE